MKTLVIIPSRLSASRLPGKPLLKINGLSIISHVYKKAQEANIGEVFVAAEDQEIIEDVRKNGGEAILTSDNHKTGTDRIYEALVKLNRTDIDLIMNLQGDEPLMNIEDIQNLNNHMIQTKRDLGTLAARIKNCDALGPAPHSTHSLIKFGDFSFGLEFTTKLTANLITLSETGTLLSNDWNEIISFFVIIGFNLSLFSEVVDLIISISFSKVG